MPRKPKATRPNAKTAGAYMSDATPSVLMPNAIAMSDTMTTPAIQNALMLPAVRPDSTLSDAPPSRLAVTTSFTCRERVDVKNVVTSGITAPAIVPQEMIVASFHHSVPSPISGINTYEARYVQATDTSDAIHTSVASGFSKSISFEFEYRALAIASLTR